MKKNLIFILITLLLLVVTSCVKENSTTTRSTDPVNTTTEGNTTTTQGSSTTTKQSTTTANQTTTTTKQTTITTKNNFPGCGPVNNNKKIFRAPQVEYVRMVCQLTGEASINKTNTRFGFEGTDLGIPVYDGEKMLIFFGDTFGDGRRLWFSNIVGYTTDFDLSDGIYFNDFLRQPYSYRVKAPVEGNHHGNIEDGEQGTTSTDGREVTKIPTGAIHIGDTTYLFFMSVRYWGKPGEWYVNYNGVAKSTDGGFNWVIIPELRWTEEEAPNFGQIFPVEDKADPDMIYIYGIPGGRFGGMKLGRVKKADFLDMSKYEYYNGTNNGQPVWVQGAEGLEAIKDNNDSYIVPPVVGEMSIIYNEYLGKWLMTYMSEDVSGIVYRTAPNHWGPWSNEQVMLINGDYTAIYGAFMHERYTEENGKRVYFIMSQFEEYEAYVFEMVFK